MGGIFFRCARRAPVEAINDVGGDVVNLFRVIKKHPAALLDELTGLGFSRAEFERQRLLDSATLTDIERAARFFYLQRAGFGGMVGSASFPAAAIRSRAMPARAIETQLAAHSARLECVTIERQAYADFIAAHDRPTTLFYLDPPYWGCENYYGKGLFDRADFARIASLMTAIKGAFILSLNDVPEVRRMFEAFHLRRLAVTTRRAARPGRTNC